MLLGCAGDEARQVSKVGEVDIRLAALSGSLVDGRPIGAGTASPSGVGGVVQQPGQALDFFLRLPESARFVTELLPGAPVLELAVLVQSASASQTFPLERAAGAAWQAGLAGAAVGPVRVRLENRAGVAVEWFEPRIVGSGRPPQAVLDASLRPPEAEGPINVLLYVVDTLRADRLSLYGYDRPTSPNLEKRAEAGLVFRNAYSTASFTMASMGSLFTSRFPSDLVRREVWPERPLAEMFSAAGYQTAGFQANVLLASDGEFARGFDEYRVVRDIGSPKAASAAQLHERVDGWLRKRARQPFFLYVQSMDMHFPYFPPAPFKDRFLREDATAPASLPKFSPEQMKQLRKAFAGFDPDLYDGCAAYTDYEIERLLGLLAELGFDERTVVVITADHGEPLGQHGQLLHGRSLYEEVVRVPLIVLLPWHRRAAIIEDVVSLLDLGPTLLDLAGIPIPSSYAGRSMLAPGGIDDVPAAFGELLRLRTRATTEAYVREGPWKLIVGADEPELYDLRSDPREERDVSADHPLEVGFLRSRVMARIPALQAGAPPPIPLHSGLPAARREELERNLKALGYLE